MYVRNLLRFLKLDAKIVLETDSAAAKGTAPRIGAGKKLRHLEVEQFFLQQLVKQGQV